MRIGTLLGIAVGIAACAESPSPVAPSALSNTPTLSAEVESSELVVPFGATLWIPCANGGTGENVALAGQLSIRSHEVVSDDGVTRLWTQWRPMGVFGVGATTGRTYRGTGGTFEGLVESDGSVYSVVNNFRIIGQGAGNNLTMHMVLKQAYNANGELTAEVNLNNQSCR
jgi:hypothetical protein